MFLGHRRTEKEAILIGAGVVRQPWAPGVAAELPPPGPWVPSPHDLATRRDLRGEPYLLASIDPPSTPPSIQSLPFPHTHTRGRAQPPSIIAT